MSTKNFLDLSGLSRVWGKIGDKFALKSLYGDTTINVGRKANTTVGTNSTAEGAYATASGNYSHAEGNYTVASSSYSHSEGYNSNATGSSTHAEGSNTFATASYSHAEGYYTAATSTSAHAEGGNNTTVTIKVTGEANATTYTVADTTNVKIGNYVKLGTIISKVTNVVNNTSITVTPTLSSSALSNSTVYVMMNVASGQYSHAEGNKVIASGTASHAEGQRTTASGNGGSHAEGRDTTAIGQCSHAEGDATTAGHASSHSEGMGTAANGYISHSEGNGTIAQRKAQHVEGEYNTLDNTGSSVSSRGKYLHIAGNGTADDARSNAYTLDWSGNGCFAGDVYAGAADKDSANAKKLATEDYVEQLTRDGVQKVILYNGKATGTAILTGAIQELSDSIFNYDLLIVGINCNIGSNLRRMEFTQPVFPHTDITEWCDTTGAGANGAFHMINCNTGFGNGNGYRVMFGFTDATHIRNIVSNPLGSWGDAGICYVIGYKFSALPDGYMQEPATEGTSGQVLTTDGNGGRTWTTVSGGGGGTSDYTQLSNKPQINSVTLTGNVSLSTLGAATEQYVDNKITYGTSDLTAGTSPLTTGTLYFVYE